MCSLLKQLASVNTHLPFRRSVWCFSTVRSLPHYIIVRGYKNVSVAVSILSHPQINTDHTISRKHMASTMRLQRGSAAVLIKTISEKHTRDSPIRSLPLYFINISGEDFVPPFFIEGPERKKFPVSLSLKINSSLPPTQKSRQPARMMQYT